MSAAWRESYITDTTARERSGEPHACVFCDLAALPPSVDSGVIAQSAHCFVCLNAYPYGSGHLLVLPIEHVGELASLTEDVAADLFAMTRRAERALSAAYEPDGFNVGMNLGRAAGAGLPRHIHMHVLPRWNGDTNFMATVGETRILPESLATTWEKVSLTWPRQL